MAFAASSALPPPMPITAPKSSPRSAATVASMKVGAGSPVILTISQLQPR